LAPTTATDLGSKKGLSCETISMRLGKIIPILASFTLEVYMDILVEDALIYPVVRLTIGRLVAKMRLT